MIDPYLVALANCPVFGARSLEKLIERFSSAEEAWKAQEGAFHDLGIPEHRLSGFFTFRAKAKPEVYVQLLSTHGIRMITKEDAEYPPLLKTIFDPPFVLFLKGAPLREPAVAVVGSRQHTSYGKDIAIQFAQSLAARGVSIISGLARGIDSAAHQGALKAGGHTAAVLGGGLLTPNNMDQENLTPVILENGGTLISEFGLHSPFIRFHFPMRNRIIAGMSKITLIVEGALPSGSLITAKAALDAGRDVFAVPGPITSPTSAGTNSLLKDGAFVATSPEDILLGLGISSKKSTPSPSLPPLQSPPRVLPPLAPLPTNIYTLLASGSLYADELSLKTSSSASEVSTALLELELMGLIKNLGGTRYERF